MSINDQGFAPPPDSPVSDTEVAAAHGIVHGRLRRRRRMFRGLTVMPLAAVAIAGATWSLSRSATGGEETVANGGASTSESAPATDSEGSVGPGRFDSGCGAVPVVADEVGIELEVTTDSTMSPPVFGESSDVFPTITVENHTDGAVRLSTASSLAPALTVIADDGSITSGVTARTLDAGALTIQPGEEAEVNGRSPRQACADIGTKELLPAGTYQVAPVALVNIDGEARLVRGALMELTYR